MWIQFIAWSKGEHHTILRKVEIISNRCMFISRINWKLINALIWMKSCTSLKRWPNNSTRVASFICKEYVNRFDHFLPTWIRNINTLNLWIRLICGKTFFRNWYEAVRLLQVKTEVCMLDIVCPMYTYWSDAAFKRLNLKKMKKGFNNKPGASFDIFKIRKSAI